MAVLMAAILFPVTVLKATAGAVEAGSFTVFSAKGAAGIYYSEADYKVVTLAATDLVADVQRVAEGGVKPGLYPTSEATVKNSGQKEVIVVGTLGHSPLVDALVSSGKVEVGQLRDKWETFLITVVADPFPGSGIEKALVIAGSDRRGTAFGIYELSQMMGVSPWHWWADVTPNKRQEYVVASGTQIFGPPSVKYRGIFINDEDWGLQPWAAQVFEPENRGIGPKTYTKVFELLLRLKANTLWPAMHACSPAFNSNPLNAQLADDYGIVMGSSHAEPMLRNNVSEWTAPHKDYNYETNPAGVFRYWEERAQSNGRYENIYTIGMRGIHDSGMQGGASKEAQIALLEKIFSDQRGLISKYVTPATGRQVEQVPQMFCAYKEVLALYRGGLKVPDDVTVMFPDDNFGYIRDFPQPSELGRKGGFGIYYHVSYLGRPMAYLWISTTPPALIWEEMRKAYDHGADRIWIVNVGDIKPAEIDTEFFLQMAWDINRWNGQNIDKYLATWAQREFGVTGEDPQRVSAAGDIARLMEMYFIYNGERRPEHLQWWLPGQKPTPSTFTAEDRARRGELEQTMSELLVTIRDRIPASKKDAFYELVDYPVQGSILANKRYFTGEEAAIKGIGGDRAELDRLGYMADVLNLQLTRITRQFNTQIAGGKWNHFMQLEPADADWKSMRISSWRVPNFQTPLQSIPADPVGAPLLVNRTPGAASEWGPISGMGRSGVVHGITPTTGGVIPLELAAKQAPVLHYQFQDDLRKKMSKDKAGLVLRVHLVPTHAIDAGGQLRLAYAFDDAAPQAAKLDIGDGGPAWAQGVLANERILEISIPAGQEAPRTLQLFGTDPSIVIDYVEIGR